MTAAPTPDQLAEALRGAITRAGDLETDGRWLHEIAYGLAARDRDRPTRPRPPNSDPDVVAGRTFDFDAAGGNARWAYNWAGELVADSHRLAGVAVCRLRVACGYDTVARQARGLPARTGRAHECTLIRDVTLTAARLRWLADHDVIRADDETRLKAWSAASHLTAAHVEVRRVLPVDRSLARRCVNCGGKARPGGRECAACVQHRSRAVRRAAKKGRRGPVAPRFDEAFRARARRVERGEDHAQAPPPWGTYRDSEWAPAVSYPNIPTQEAS